MGEEDRHIRQWQWTWQLAMLGHGAKGGTGREVDTAGHPIAILQVMAEERRRGGEGGMVSDPLVMQDRREEWRASIL